DRGGAARENFVVGPSANKGLQQKQRPATDRINAVDSWERKSQGLRWRRCYWQLKVVRRRLDNRFRLRSLNFVDRRERLRGLASEKAELTIQHRAQQDSENGDHGRPCQGCGTHAVP